MFSELFPTFIRTTGIGMSVAIGRLGGVCAPIATSYIYEHTGDGKNVPGALGLLIAVLSSTVLVLVPWGILGREGTGQSLEDLGGEEVSCSKDDEKSKA
jgi:nitrate/nitrite transporter NarK